MLLTLDPAVQKLDITPKVHVVVSTDCSRGHVARFHSSLDPHWRCLGWHLLAARQEVRGRCWGVRPRIWLREVFGVALGFFQGASWALVPSRLRKRTAVSLPPNNGELEGTTFLLERPMFRCELLVLGGGYIFFLGELGFDIYIFFLRGGGKTRSGEEFSKGKLLMIGAQVDLFVVCFLRWMVQHISLGAYSATTTIVFST